jgi:HEPN domain-containing protein
MGRKVAEVLSERVASDLRTARKLASCSDIADQAIGFYAQQVVEKSLKSVLAFGDVDFPMMEHDLDFLLTLATENRVELSPELVDTGWLTPWAITYENAEPSPGPLDRRQAIEIAEAAVSWSVSRITVGTETSKPEAADGVPPPPPPPTENLGRPETRGGPLGRNTLPDTSSEAVQQRPETKLGTLADFEAEYGPRRPPDGDG